MVKKCSAAAAEPSQEFTGGDFGGEGSPIAHNAQLAPFKALTAGLDPASLAPPRSQSDFKLVLNFKQRPLIGWSCD